MFGWFKRKKDKPATSQSSGDAESEPLLAFVLLDRDTFDLDPVIAQLQREGVGGRKATDISGGGGEPFACELGDELCAISHMPGPFPWSDLEGPCRTAWMWPPKVDPMSLREHKSHVLITLMRGQGSRIGRRLLLTAVTSLIASQRGAVGVYWGEATMVHFPPVFIDLAKEATTPDTPPLYLWVDYRVFKNEDGSTGMFTHGLEGLGHMEIEIPSIDMEPGELREWAMNITYYLLENGPVLKDGQTIGVNEEHRMKIHHTTSRYGHEGTVMCFEG